jgi:hypothetical protein
MDACPICRASLNGAATCRRCRADLDKVQAVERRGQALAMAALHALVQGDSVSAALWLERARRVHTTPAVRALRELMDAADRRGNEDPAVAVAAVAQRDIQ